MAVIIRAAEGYAGIPTGFPILLTDRMVIVEPAFDFLIKQAVIPGRGRAAKTVQTYAEHLHDWFDSLEQSGLGWRDVGIETVAAYRNRMLEVPSPHTRRPYARSTINDRIRTVCRFYAWALRSGWIDAPPFHFVDVRVGWRGSFLAHADRRAGVMSSNVLTLAQQESLPRPLRTDQLRRLFAALAPPYRLMAQWALATGMRRKEVCGLTLAQLPETARLDLDEDPLVGVPLSITKGDRPRTVYPPLRLVDRTHWYIGEDRASLVKRMRARRPGHLPPSSLFLNGRGDPVTSARLTAAVAQAFRAAGLRGSLHWLRHTFAMTMLVRLQQQATRAPAINPLKIVQVLLGHASIQTTAIYLRCVELHGRELAESLEYLYGELIGDAT